VFILTFQLLHFITLIQNINPNNWL